MEFFAYGLTLTLLIGQIYSIDGTNVAVDTQKLSFDNLNSIFNAMKAYGLTKKPANQKRANQYTCTTVLAEEEVNDISWLRNGKELEFPEKFTTDDRRIRVQYNENSNKDHGEKIVLESYLGGLIAEMQKDSTANKLNVYPVVVMYSYYIPCSMTTQVCAERLAKDKMSRETKYSLIVGYSDYFKYRFKNAKDNTVKNIETSFKTLQEGQIDVYYMIRDFSNQLSVLVLQDKFSDIFQTNLYNCLMKQPLAYSCSTSLNKENAPDALDNVKRIVTFSINSMIHSCSSYLDSVLFLERSLVEQLKLCTERWIDTNIGPDCHGSYGRRDLIFYAMSCIKQTLKFSAYVGALENPNRLDDPSWKHGSIQWPNGFRLTNALYCHNPLLRPDSFCTKIESEPTTRTYDMYELIKRRRHQ